MLHGHGGQGRLCGGRPQLQDVEHSQMVPQTGWPAAAVRGRAEQTLWGLEDLEPRVMEDTDNDSGPNGVQQEPERIEVLIDLGHTGLHSMGERTPPLPHQV